MQQFFLKKCQNHLNILNEWKAIKRRNRLVIKTYANDYDSDTYKTHICPVMNLYRINLNIRKDINMKVKLKQYFTWLNFSEEDFNKPINDDF